MQPIKLILIFVIFLISCSDKSEETSVMINGWFAGRIQGRQLELIGQVETLAGKGGVAGSSDGLGTNATFNGPADIIIDKSKNYLFVSDFNNSTIRRITIETGKVDTVLGSAGIQGNVDGIGTAARLNRPIGLTILNDYLYWVEFGGHVLRRAKLDTFQVETLAGTYGNPGFTNGTGLDVQFNFPEGVTTDGTFLYIVELKNHAIRKVNLSNFTVTTLAGDGTIGTADTTLLQSQFNHPTKFVWLDSKLYLTDFENYSLRKVDITANSVTTFAGLSGTPGGEDGVGGNARFQKLAGVTTDGYHLYLGAYGGHTVRKVGLSNRIVETIAGASETSGYLDGAALDARFNDIAGLTTDGEKIYLVEYSNHTIRVLK